MEMNIENVIMAVMMIGGMILMYISNRGINKEKERLGYGSGYPEHEDEQ